MNHGNSLKTMSDNIRLFHNLSASYNLYMIHGSFLSFIYLLNFKIRPN